METLKHCALANANIVATASQLSTSDGVCRLILCLHKASLCACCSYRTLLQRSYSAHSTVSTELYYSADVIAVYLLTLLYFCLLSYFNSARCAAATNLLVIPLWLSVSVRSATAIKLYNMIALKLCSLYRIYRILLLCYGHGISTYISASWYNNSTTPTGGNNVIRSNYGCVNIEGYMGF